MLEQILHFLCVFNNLTSYIIECISWTIKYLILLMHGETMKMTSICDSKEHVSCFLTCYKYSRRVCCLSIACINPAVVKRFASDVMSYRINLIILLDERFQTFLFSNAFSNKEIKK